MFRLTGNVSVPGVRAISPFVVGQPNGMAQALSSFRRVRNFLQEEYDRAFRHDHWNIGVVDAPISRFLEPERMLDVRWFPPPRSGSYYADPFGVVRGGVTELFFEEYDFRSDKGVISHVRETADGGFSSPEVEIDLRVHASYPYLVEREGRVYCIPETSHAREIALYQAADFPHRWSKIATLVPGVAGVDPTLVEHDGMLWLFATDLDDGPFSKLRIWYAPALLGPWKPHPQNPVKTDVRSARPGGTPFMIGGDLYRPAQDSSSTYGGSIALNHIVRLTTAEFREEPVATVGPLRDGPYAHGLHTLSAVGDRTLVDGKWLAFNRSEMARHLRESLEVRWPRVLLGG